jgi:hypothetical protein
MLELAEESRLAAHHQGADKQPDLQPYPAKIDIPHCVYHGVCHAGHPASRLMRDQH